MSIVQIDMLTLIWPGCQSVSRISSPEISQRHLNSWLYRSRFHACEPCIKGLSLAWKRSCLPLRKHFQPFPTLEKIQAIYIPECGTWEESLKYKTVNKAVKINLTEWSDTFPLWISIKVDSGLEIRANQTNMKILSNDQTYEIRFNPSKVHKYDFRKILPAIRIWTYEIGCTFFYLLCK